MSEFTTQVRYICEKYANYDSSQNYVKVDDIIQSALPSIFDFSFPIFSEPYRNVLETKIIIHYYTREIGLETVGLWKLKLETKLNEIMPYYNKLYESELIEFNPMWDVDYTIDHEGEVDKTGTVRNAGTVDNTGTVRNAGTINNTGTVGNSRNLTSVIDNDERNVYDEDIANNLDTTVTGSNSSNNDDAFSDTPQGQLSDVKTGKYLSSFRNIANSSTNTSTTNTDETTDRTETVTKSQDATKTDAETSTRTDNLQQAEDRTRTDNLRRAEDKTRTDNLKTTDEYVQKVSGKMYKGSYSKMLNEFRDTFLNIDLMIIKDLSELFMNVW